ncbi:multicopper oxidase family protein [Nocardioides scoriae]|uniref:multicopper oxidase family protein n=1 Tax=Nocardioides scoriae TaxID=642780 RepID=UPI001E4C8C2D|nr:multicopper oxidase family protein [Nocardioides scoriae]
MAVALTLALVGPLAWLWWSSLLPASYSAAEMGEMDLGGGPGSSSHGGHGSTSVAELSGPRTGEPDVVVDLTARQGTVRLADGEQVEGYTLDGSSPGPLVEAEVGDLVEVTLRNADVAGGVALHWHGVDVPNAEDGVAGVTQDAVAPGESHTYRWVAPDAGTYWYHSHQLSHEQVVGGLLGPLVVHPRGDRGPRDVLALAHLYAGKPTVNGRHGVEAVVADPGERVRVRVVNTDDGPTAVWAGAAYRLVAVDGTDVHRPGVVRDRAVAVPAGGRVDLELDVPADGSAVRVSLPGDVGLVIGPEGASAPEVPEPGDRVDLLTYGEPADLGLDPDRADRRFGYSIGRRPGFLDGRPGLWWSVNGRLLPDMPMFVVREGDVVRVSISNHSGTVHPMHLHGHHTVVLSRDGVAASGSPWWFDSLDVGDGHRFEVAFVADNPGIWMDHCHNLAHAREGLVTHLMYDGVTTPYRLGDDGGNVPE